MPSKSIDVLSQCALILQLTGFQYFSIKGIFKERDRKCSKFYYNIYFAFLILFLPFLTLCVAVMLSNENEESAEEDLNIRNAFNLFIQVLTELGFFAVTIIGLLSAYVGTKRMKKFHLNLIRYDEKVTNLSDYPVNYKKFRRHVIINCLSQILYLNLGGLLNIIKPDTDELLLRFPFNMILLLPLFTCLMASFMYIYHVILINIHLEHMNRLLSDLFPPCEQKLRTITKVKSCETPTYSVETIRELYNVIKENSEILNTHQGISMLANFIFNSIFGVMSVYRIFLIMIGKIDSGINGIEKVDSV